MPTKLVIFDLDGVIINSVSLIYEAIWGLCSEHHSFRVKNPPTFPNFLKSFRLPGDQWFESYGFDFPSEVIRETLRHAPDKAEMFSTVPPMLERIRRKSKLPVIIISAGDQSRIERQLEEGGIQRHFEAVIGETPDKAEAISSFCSLWGICPAEAIYVGDMPSDMEHAHEAGVTPIGYTDESSMMRGVLTKAGAKYCVPSHHALGKLLVGLARA
jgi:phosphoglycolate phosphatase-like HAD superfamily hydrolase